MVGTVDDSIPGDHSPERHPDQDKPAVDAEPSNAGRPFAELTDSGLLWLINATVFHPRGLALSLHQDGPDGPVIGWSVAGTGDRPTYVSRDQADRWFTTADLFLWQTRRCNVLDGSPVDVAEINRIVDHDAGYAITREDIPSHVRVLPVDGGPPVRGVAAVRAVYERAAEAFGVTELPDYLRDDRDRSELVEVPERVDALPPLDDAEHDRAADQ